MSEELIFHGLRGRTFEDQQQAMIDGYGSVTEMAVDELGFMLVDLIKRVEALETHLASAHAASFAIGDSDAS